ncbi:hypothetical protein HMSSN036_87110 [Paenibacillus macerans]|nr:hypothetical protein HMSSN036_87110 [Paenibacillus macerans]
MNILKLNQKQKLDRFFKDTGDAIQLIKDINREKRIKNFTHTHLEVWKNVIAEISKENNQLANRTLNTNIFYNLFSNLIVHYQICRNT